VSYRKQELLTLREHLRSTQVFLVGSVLLILLLFCVVLLCVLTFWVTYCDIRSDVCINTMFCSSLPPVICRMVHVLFTLFVFVCMLCFCFVFLPSCVPSVASAVFSNINLYYFTMYMCIPLLVDLIPQGFIRQVVSASALIWFIKYC
jgi:hypothetical protein